MFIIHRKPESLANFFAKNVLFLNSYIARSNLDRFQEISSESLREAHVHLQGFRISNHIIPSFFSYSSVSGSGFATKNFPSKSFFFISLYAISLHVRVRNRSCCNINKSFVSALLNILAASFI